MSDKNDYVNSWINRPSIHLHIDSPHLRFLIEEVNPFTILTYHCRNDSPPAFPTRGWRLSISRQWYV